MVWNLLTRRVATVAACGVLGVGGAVLAVDSLVSPASAATPTATASPAASPTAATGSGATGTVKHPKIAALARRVVHGEFTVKTKDGYQVFDTQRGSVTAVSASSITVKSPDGVSGTFTVSSDTKVHKGRQSEAISAVTVGEQALVVAKVNGSARSATQIVTPAK